MFVGQDTIEKDTKIIFVISWGGSKMLKMQCKEQLS